MQEFLKWLAADPYVLLFTVVAGAVLLGRVSIKGYGLGIAASTVLVAITLSGIRCVGPGCPRAAPG